MQETLRVSGQVAGVSQAHPSPDDRVDVLGDDVKDIGKGGDQDVHHSVLKPSQVQLQVQCGHHLLEGPPPSCLQQGTGPQGPAHIPMLPAHRRP